jgi:hypothetical protein
MRAPPSITTLNAISHHSNTNTIPSGPYWWWCWVIVVDRLNPARGCALAGEVQGPVEVGGGFTLREVSGCLPEAADLLAGRGSASGLSRGLGDSVDNAAVVVAIRDPQVSRVHGLLVAPFLRSSRASLACPTTT